MAAVSKRRRSCPGTKLRRCGDPTVVAGARVAPLCTRGSWDGLPGLMLAILLLVPFKKDKYSNLCDCPQYGCLALGEGRRITGRPPMTELRGVQTIRRKSMRRVVA